MPLNFDKNVTSAEYSAKTYVKTNQVPIYQKEVMFNLKSDVKSKTFSVPSMNIGKPLKARKTSKRKATNSKFLKSRCFNDYLNSLSPANKKQKIE